MWGLTEEEAQAAGRAFRTSTFALSASGKAVAMGESRGWVKLIEDSEAGRLIGAHLMGPHVSEMASGLALAIRSGMTATDIADTIHPPSNHLREHSGSGTGLPRRPHSLRVENQISQSNMIDE